MLTKIFVDNNAFWCYFPLNSMRGKAMGKSSKLGSRSDWKLFGGRIPPELAKAVRILSVKNDLSIQDLIIEALTDVLIKYGEEPPKL